MKTFFKILLSIAVGMNVLSSYGLTLKEQIAIYAVQQQYAKICDIAEQIQNNNSDFRSYTTDELYALSLAASIYYTNGDSISGYKCAEAPAKWFLNKYSKLAQDFPSYSFKQKKESIVALNNDYSACKPALYLLKDEYAKQVSSLHHNLAVKNRRLFAEGTIEDWIMIPRILAEDVLWMQLNTRMEMALSIHFPAMMELPNKCHSYEEKLLIATSIAAAMKVMQPELMNYLFLSTKDSDIYLYAPAITDFLLVQHELELYINGHKSSENYYEVSWKKIRQELTPDEVAILMFETNLVSMPLEGYITISQENDMPNCSIFRVGSLINQAIDFSNLYSEKKKIYLTIPYHFTNYNEDIVYSAQNVYIKQTLYDVVRKNNQSAGYGGGTVEMMADINYSPESKCPPLQEKRKLIESLSQNFPNKVYVLSGYNVRIINFINLSSDIEILHVSTHGVIPLSHDNPISSPNEVFNTLLGLDKLSSPYLCLSNYNGKIDEHTLSVYDIIRKVDLRHQGLVFLDACNTAYSSPNAFTGLASIARACYIVGAQNVIAYLSPINEKVATDFAITFYKKIADNHDITYHDAFYQTKKEIIEKYKDTGYLRRDYKNNRPQLDIVLWE